MKRTCGKCALLMAAAVVAGSMAFADNPAPRDGPGWTGITNPAEMIAAREALMVEIERVMEPIDTFGIGEPDDLDELRSAAEVVATMLRVVPHLFPPTTNLYDPAVKTPATLALPAIWKDFPTFYKLADAATSAATRMASTQGEAPLRAAALSVRATCDACHALYLRPYVPSKVTKEDLDFDFDSALRKK